MRRTFVLSAMLLALSAIRALWNATLPRDPPEQFLPAALLALLAALVPLTAFDCPLQVAPVAQLAFLAAGGLAPVAIGRFRPFARRRWLATASTALGIGSGAYLGAQVTSGVLVDRESLELRDLGARLAPANPRLQVMVGADWAWIGRFDRCVPRAERALESAPTFQLARLLLDACLAKRPLKRAP